MLISLASIRNQYKEWLDQVGYVVHVGAHRAEEAPDYNDADWPVLWIDANVDYIAAINDNLHYPKQRAVLATIWDTKKQSLTFNVSSNDGMSSSLLDLKLHAISYPSITYVEQRTVETTTLDDVVFGPDGIPDNISPLFLNLDIQGTELRAMKGGKKTLARTIAIYTEVNTAEVYAGCDQLPEMIDYLASEGFTLECKSMTGEHWGDALFLRDKKTI